MKWPFVSKTITAGFDQPRPLSVPENRRTHVHGAIDVPGGIGDVIVAPESGDMVCFCAFRRDTSQGMYDIDLDDFGFDLQGHHYFYDVYGAITFFFGDSGITHVFCHSFMNQLFNRPAVTGRWRYEESERIERFPVVAFFMPNYKKLHFRRGAEIARFGNAGYSTGPHVHYEMHDGRIWNAHAERPRPSEFYKEAKDA